MVGFHTALAFVALAGTALAAPLFPRQTCYSGLYIIVARGSLEAPGEGVSAAVATLIEAKIPNSGSVAVDYPAAIISNSSVYPASVVVGIDDTLSKIETYVAACGSSSRIALVGYSQGGNVMTDALAGGILKPAPLASTYKQYIKAVVVFGDPTFVAGESYDAGTATTNGIFTRADDPSSLALLNTYSSVLKSYCETGDPICADGLDLEVHLTEVQTNEVAAAAFVASIV